MDALESMQDVLSALHPIPDEEWDSISSKAEIISVPKKTRIVDLGQIARELYFVTQGSIRLYYLKDGSEFTGFIFTENLFAASLESFIDQVPSNQILETIEDCDLISIPHSHVMDLLQSSEYFKTIWRVQAERRFINAQKILSSFILETPEERYKHLLENQPELIHRIPHHIIASYLGITPVSLSRIRARLAED